MGKIRTSLAVLIASVLAPSAEGALILRIQAATSNRLSFTISGTLDQDVQGSQPNWIAIKADWSGNVAVNTDWINDALINDDYRSFPQIVIEEDTIEIEGFWIGTKYISGFGSQGAPLPFGDALFWGVYGQIPAGTQISGTLSLLIPDGFKFEPVHELQLLSGFDDSTRSWVRLEAAAPIPEASVGVLAGFAPILLFVRRRKIQQAEPSAGCQPAAGLRDV